MTVSSGNIIDGVYFRRFGELCFSKVFDDKSELHFPVFVAFGFPCLFVERKFV